MRKSLRHLPKSKRREIERIAETLRQNVVHCEMMILYGSYARGDYVEYDEQFVDGVTTWFMSDYDILLIVRHKSDISPAFTAIDKIEDTIPLENTRPHMIVEHYQDFNEEISRQKFFYATIKREGILLYSSGKYPMPRLKRLCWREIHNQAQEYFGIAWSTAEGFWKATRFHYEQKQWRLCAFCQHQAVENSLKCISLVFTLYSPKEHEPGGLAKRIRDYAPNIAKLLQYRNEEEKPLLEFLRDAYVKSRYDPKFVVPIEYLDAMFPRIDAICTMTKEICRKQIDRMDPKQRPRGLPLGPVRLPFIEPK